MTQEIGREILRAMAERNQAWIQGACVLVQQMPDNDYTGESIRAYLTSVGHPAPHHHNSWGALTRVLISRNLIRATGEFSHMTSTRSHGRKTAVYRKV